MTTKHKVGRSLLAERRRDQQLALARKRSIAADKRAKLHATHIRTIRTSLDKIDPKHSQQAIFWRGVRATVFWIFFVAVALIILQQVMR
jgi:hypothetical protein